MISYRLDQHKQAKRLVAMSDPQAADLSHTLLFPHKKRSQVDREPTCKYYLLTNHTVLLHACIDAPRTLLNSFRLPGPTPLWVEEEVAVPSVPELSDCSSSDEDSARPVSAATQHRLLDRVSA